MQNVTAGLRVNEKIVAKFVADYLPFIATENLLMAAVERGGDRQQVHEIIRRASMRATEAMKTVSLGISLQNWPPSRPLA